MQGFGNCKYGSMARGVLRPGVNLILTAATGTVALQSWSNAGGTPALPGCGDRAPIVVS